MNYGDGLFVQGKYQIKPPVPFTPGGEVAGDVVAVGEGVDSVAIGDRVLAMSFLGGYASHVEVPAASVVPVPESLSYGQAAGLVQSYGTMLFSLTRRTKVEPGEWVLVRSEEHTSELQSLMRISYAVFCLKKKNTKH